MGRAAHIRDTGGDPNSRDDRLNAALAQGLAIAAKKDALLVWLSWLPIEARVLPDQLGDLWADANFALTLAFATDLDMALLLAVDLIEVVERESCEFTMIALCQPSGQSWCSHESPVASRCHMRPASPPDARH